MHLTQKEFAQLVGCSKSTIERWEISKSPITGPLVLLLRLMEQSPEQVLSLQIASKRFPLRLWYMYKQELCTLIDVDEVKQRIEVKNYTDNVMFRAFGATEQPTFTQYKDFLESRCFPRSRDKMKLILKDLNIPFYDPLLIIEKTEGKMAEDDFWIRIER